MLAVVVASLALPPIAFFALLLALTWLGMYELAAAFARIDVRVSLPPLWVGALGILVCAWQLGAEAMLAALFGTVVAVVAFRLMDSAGSACLRDVMISTLVAVYVPFQAGFAMMLLARGGVPAILLFVLTTISNDIGGYVSGVLFGRHPLAPSVSPSKSWEGFAGSALMSAAVCAVGMHLQGLPWWLGALLGVASAVLATCGDLGESLIKRDLGLKDMGYLLPGHGGFMDRLDSLVVTAPLFFVTYATWLGW